MIEPDTKDWTWVLERTCPECGFLATELERAAYGNLVRENAALWGPVLAGPDASARPNPAVWSPLEYACHVRDVHLVFSNRVDRMLVEDEPRFSNWDQDQTAVEERYGLQEPAVVARELRQAAERVAQKYDDVADTDWSRRGLRSDGAEFTVESIGRYHLHDVVHHAWDVGAVSR